MKFVHGAWAAFRVAQWIASSVGVAIAAPVVAPAPVVSSAPFVLISGFDDVLRQAENQSLYRAALRLFAPDRTFVGMPELYEGLSEKATPPPASPRNRFAVVSAISDLFRGRILRFLTATYFPSAYVRTRSWVLEPSIETFKRSAIRGVLQGDDAIRFILIFDDSGPSLAMARSLPTSFSGRVLAVYLHEIVPRPGDFGSFETPTRFYVTPFDIARSEFEAGRLSASAVTRVADAITSAKEFSDVVPTYAVCPTDYDPCAPPISILLVKTCEGVRERVRTGCRSRKRS